MPNVGENVYVTKIDSTYCTVLCNSTELCSNYCNIQIMQCTANSVDKTGNSLRNDKLQKCIYSQAPSSLPPPLLSPTLTESATTGMHVILLLSQYTCATVLNSHSGTTSSTLNCTLHQLAFMQHTSLSNVK